MATNYKLDNAPRYTILTLGSVRGKKGIFLCTNTHTYTHLQRTLTNQLFDIVAGGVVCCARANVEHYSNHLPG